MGFAQGISVDFLKDLLLPAPDCRLGSWVSGLTPKNRGSCLGSYTTCFGTPHAFQRQAKAVSTRRLRPDPRSVGSTPQHPKTQNNPKPLEGLSF